MSARNRNRRRSTLDRAAAAENKLWPWDLVEIDVPTSLTEQQGCPTQRAWRSRRFLVQQFIDAEHVRISVQRVEHAAFRSDAVERPISWDDLMDVKRQIGMGDVWAVEIFPPDDQVIDVARMRHLWIVDQESVPFAWRSPERQPERNPR